MKIVNHEGQDRVVPALAELLINLHTPTELILQAQLSANVIMLGLVSSA